MTARHPSGGRTGRQPRACDRAPLVPASGATTSLLGPGARIGVVAVAIVTWPIVALQVWLL